MTKELIFSQLDSTEAFPVDFEEAWKWLGYSRKDPAKRSLLSSGFEENSDFHLHINVEPNHTKGLSHREQIYLTIDCFKAWCMMAPTEKGKEVRRYYLEVEKEWKQLLTKHQEPTTIVEPNWLQARSNGQSVHIMFQANCIRNSVPANRVHDFITVLVTGHKALTARELPLVGSDPEVGLDHHPSTEHQMTIATLNVPGYPSSPRYQRSDA